MVLREERTGIDKKFFELCQKVVSEEGLVLYDMDYLPGSLSLRIYIYDQSTNTAVIEDCVKVDHALTPYFESEEWMPEEISLEVSSPGVYRTLKTIEQFKMAEGEKIELALRAAIEDEEAPKAVKKNKKFTAVLVSADDEKLKLDADGYNFELMYNNIKKANVDKDL